MEVKKNYKVNIEKTRVIYFQLGLVIVLSLSLIAFEWASVPGNANEYIQDGGSLLDQEIIPITFNEPEPPAIPPEIPSFTEIFEIVNEEVPLEMEPRFFDDGAKNDDVVNIYRIIVTDEPEVKEEEIFVTAEDMPTFQGGDQGTFARWVQQNIHYPEVSAENRIHGKVFVEFVVEPDGTVSNVDVIRGVDPALDDEAARVIKNSPKWVAGRQLGIPVRIRFTITVNFQLQ